MERGDSTGIADLFDIDLEGLDFETAYELVNGKAGSLYDVNEGLPLNLAEDHLLEQSSGENARQLIQSNDMVNVGAHVVPNSPNGTVNSHNSNQLEGLGNVHLEGLLSVNECNAIESFLDSLLTASSNKGINIPMSSPMSQVTDPAIVLKKEVEETYTFGKDELRKESDFALIEHSLPIHSLDGNERTGITSNEISSRACTDQESSTRRLNMDLQVKSLFDKFKQIDPKIPVVNIPDDVIPEEVKKDSAGLRKWKHVYLEKQRRNAFKKEYDELIGMIRYPRPDWSLINTYIPKTKKLISHDYKIPKKEGRRVSKHTLLNYIIEDIQLLLIANEELEQLYIS